MEPTQECDGASTRGVFDHAVDVAYVRWAILRRTASYRRGVEELCQFGAESFFDKHGAHPWNPETLAAFFLAQWGGVIPAPPDRQHKDGTVSSEGRRRHAEVLRVHGLRVVLHHAVHIPVADMASFPIFIDTPARQPIVIDQELLRRLARHPGPHGAIADRPLHQAIQLPKRRRRVDRTGFVVRGQRIHRETFDRDLRVFDLRVKGISPRDVARELWLTRDEEKRAWRRAITLIPDWRPARWEQSLTDHLSQCPICVDVEAGRRKDLCPAMQQQVDWLVRPPAGPRQPDLTRSLQYNDSLGYTTT